MLGALTGAAAGGMVAAASASLPVSLPTPTHYFEYNNTATSTTTPTLTQNFSSGCSFDATNKQFGSHSAAFTANAVNRINEYANLSVTFAAPAAGLTLATWVRLTATVTNTTFYSIADYAPAAFTTKAIRFGFLGNGSTPQVAFQVRRGGTTTTYSSAACTIATNTWTHVAWKASAGAGFDTANTWTLYVNGTPLATVDAFSVYSDNIRYVDVGSTVDSGNQPRNFAGNLDSYRFYSSALSDAQVAAVYQLTS